MSSIFWRARESILKKFPTKFRALSSHWHLSHSEDCLKVMTVSQLRLSHSDECLTVATVSQWVLFRRRVFLNLNSVLYPALGPAAAFAEPDLGPGAECEAAGGPGTRPGPTWR